MSKNKPLKVKVCKKLKPVKSHSIENPEYEKMELFYFMSSGPYFQSRNLEKD